MNGSRAWFEKDFYSALGVPETARAEEIKRAYKKLARQYHPDKNPNDKVAEEKMKDISEANTVLSDPEKRKEYDQMRHMARTGYAGGTPGAGWQTNVRFEDIPFDLGDLFGGAFGGGGRRRRSADVEASVRIPFEDSINGVTIPVRVGGEEFKVKIPAGVNDGARVRARGRGEAGGDLYVRVEVEPHPVFGRKGKDVMTTVSIPFTVAALGGHITAPTLNGKPVKLNIPPGTQSGKTFRVRGKGVPEKSDLLVKVQVEVPTDLTDTERELIEKLAEVRKEKV